MLLFSHPRHMPPAAEVIDLTEDPPKTIYDIIDLTDEPPQPGKKQNKGKEKKKKKQHQPEQIALADAPPDGVIPPILQVIDLTQDDEATPAYSIATMSAPEFGIAVGDLMTACHNQLGQQYIEKSAASALNKVLYTHIPGDPTRLLGFTTYNTVQNKKSSYLYVELLCSNSGHGRKILQELRKLYSPVTIKLNAVVGAVGFYLRYGFKFAYKEHEEYYKKHKLLRTETARMVMVWRQDADAPP